MSETESSGSTGTVDNASKTSGESEVGVYYSDYLAVNWAQNRLDLLLLHNAFTHSPYESL